MNMTNEKTFAEHMSYIIDFVVSNAQKELARGNEEAIKIVLAAFNEMQDDERGGADYIFNIYNKDDLKFLTDKELIGAKDIAHVVNNPCEFPCGMFFMNECTDGMQPVQDLTNVLIGWLEEITKFVFLYVARGGKDTAYKAYYERFFVDKVWQIDYFYNIF